MPAGTEKTDRWLWYAARTYRCVPLDTEAYPFIIFAGAPRPRPEWVCQAPNGGLHIDSRVGRVDIDVAQAPVSGIELNWTCDYGVRVVSRAWLAEIEDLLEDSAVAIGEVRHKGRPLKNWATLHQANAPPLLGSEGWADACPVCGYWSSVFRGRRFFADPSVRGRPVIVNGRAIFVREDLALGRYLRTPAGSFKPVAVKFLADPPPVKGRPAWLNALGSPSPGQELQQASGRRWGNILSAVRDWFAL